MFQEEELSIVMKEPGILCVPVTGKTMERKHELSVVPLDITLVKSRCFSTYLPNFNIFQMQL